jgi:hypothetical protein
VKETRQRHVLPLIIMCAAAGPAAAQKEFCDPGLPASATNPVHYQARGSAKEQNDRCEGIYVREVAGASMLIASFTASFSDFDASIAEPLRIEWPAIPAFSAPVRLRAYGLRQKLYYRMDTAKPPRPGTFTWPTSVLAALNIRRDDVGVVGWTERPVGPTKRNVYLPLRVRQRQASAANDGYRVVLVPGRELSEVYITVATVDAQGKRAKYVRKGVPLQLGYYPAGKAIVVPVTDPGTAGVYYLELAATLRSGGSAAVDLWFYHAGD